MKLNKKQYEFSNNAITHQYPWQLDLDHLLVNVYLLLKHDGRKPTVRGGRATKYTVEMLTDFLVRQEAYGNVRGFGDHAYVIEEWIYSDLVKLTHRGREDKEKYAAPEPLHLDVPRLRVNSQIEDKGASKQLYAMIAYVDPRLIEELKRVLSDDSGTSLDLYTQAILRMIEVGGLEEKPTSKSEPLEAPLCIGQARLLCDDVRRLLAYRSRLPRAVMVEYLRALFGLHLGLYALRIAHQLSGWLSEQAAHPTCHRCPVYAHEPHPMASCPFACQNNNGERSTYAMPEILVDMGDDYRSHMARLAQSSFNQHHARLTDYIRAVLTINQVMRAAKTTKVQRRLDHEVITLDDALDVLRNPPGILFDFFDDEIDSLFEDGIDDEPRDVLAIHRDQSLSSFDKFVELVALKRTAYYQKYLREQLDSNLMKNTDSGLLMQGKGSRNTRRWHIGSRLLELLAHIALLEPSDDGFRPRTLLIDEFTMWLRSRYGIVFMSDRADASIEDITAYNENQKALRQRLREIGLYVDLSDAYNTQRLRPRYRID